MAQSTRQKKVVGRVMHEFKHHELKSAGRKVRNPKQAIAIALSEAGASRKQTAPQSDQRSRAELYAEAKRRGIPGRSRMGKDELARALSR
jgi:hypothetical protein